MSKSKNRPDVDTLLAERARFEAWLDQLLAKASKVPPHVVERVRGDYETRLARVVEELRSRADDLRAETESIEARLAKFEQELGARKDVRAEDELRAMVGEYDDVAWMAKAAEHDEGIQRVQAERDRGQADLTRMREMLSQTTRPSHAMRAIDETMIPDEPTTAASTVTGAGPSAPDGKKPGAQFPPAPGLPAATDAPPQRGASPFDEIGFLRTVVGRATPFAGTDSSARRNSVAQPEVSAAPELPLAAAPPTAASPVSAAVPAAAAPAAPAPPAHIAAPAPSHAPPPPLPPPPSVAAAPVPVAPPPAPVMPPPPVPVAPAAVVPAPAPIPVAAVPVAPPAAPPTAFATMRGSIQPMPSFEEPMLDEPVAPTAEAEADARAAEASRTLKCQECGWMNYPTEWYCEKCGGELAAF